MFDLPFQVVPPPLVMRQFVKLSVFLPRRPGFSFVGVVFDTPLVAQVRITSGQRALGADVQDLSDGGNLDLVVMDDYLYAEPQAIQ